MNRINLLKEKKVEEVKQEINVLQPKYRDEFCSIEEFCETFNLVEEQWQQQ